MHSLHWPHGRNECINTEYNLKNTSELEICVGTNVNTEHHNNVADQDSVSVWVKQTYRSAGILQWW